MHRYARFLVMMASCVLSSVVPAGEVVTYELLPGSLIRDECLYCDRVPIVRPIQGTFVLEAGEPVIGSVNFTVHDIAFQDEAGEYAVTGEGKYHYLVLAATEQEMELDIAVNGGALAHVVSGMVPMVVPLVQPWPLIDITVKDEKPQDENHVYTLHIFAAPRPAGWKTYELAEGSVLIDECVICGKPTIPVPITGTFRLGEIPGDAGGLYAYYVVGAIDFKSVAADPPYVVAGAGLYRQGGEVALTQSMFLLVTVNDTADVPLGSGIVPVPEPFPAIDITVAHVNPPDPAHVYSLEIIAKPGEPLPPQFRRGDVNADARLNIADPVYALNYLFAHGPLPTCMDTVDANDDGKLDISDPVKILSHLFGGTGPLPAPFERCGPDLTPDPLTCERFFPCQ